MATQFMAGYCVLSLGLCPSSWCVALGCAPSRRRRVRVLCFLLERQRGVQNCIVDAAIGKDPTMMELVRPQSPASEMSGHSDMVWIPGGTFHMGSDRHYAE